MLGGAGLRDFVGLMGCRGSFGACWGKLSLQTYPRHSCRLGGFSRCSAGAGCRDCPPVWCLALSRGVLAGACKRAQHSCEHL